MKIGIEVSDKQKIYKKEYNALLNDNFIFGFVKGENPNNIFFK